MASGDFAAWLGECRDNGQRDIAFLIGGADGLDDSIVGRAGLKLSLGRMTWPHLMARLLLVEQLYRAHTILTGHPYHRA
jgi:23S rRNA (pseudouridine1915-N3)-methyltransferase